jgi:hypothetical protein
LNGRLNRNCPHWRVIRLALAWLRRRLVNDSRRRGRKRRPCDYPRPVISDGFEGMLERRRLRYNRPWPVLRRLRLRVGFQSLGDAGINDSVLFGDGSEAVRYSRSGWWLRRRCRRGFSKPLAALLTEGPTRLVHRFAFGTDDTFLLHWWFTLLAMMAV